MKKLIILILTSILLQVSYAQDIDFYLKNKNDNYKLPSIPEEMTFQEFYLLSQTYRMQDMLFATIVPGYIHFKAQENKTAYTLVGLRCLSAGMLTYEYFKFKKMSDSTNFAQLVFHGSGNQLITKADQYIITSAILTATATYLFDLIHGKYILEKKQEQIRFKYSPRISFISALDKQKITPQFGLALQISF